MKITQEKMDQVFILGLEAIVSSVMLAAKAAMSPDKLDFNGPVKIIEEIKAILFPAIAEEREEKVKKVKEMFSDEKAMAPMKMTLPDLGNKGLIKKIKD